MADVPVLQGIAARAYSVYVERIGGRPWPMDADYEERRREAEVFVAESADCAVVGLVVLEPSADHVLIENVAVDPDREVGWQIGSQYARVYFSARLDGTPRHRRLT